MKIPTFIKITTIVVALICIGIVSSYYVTKYGAPAYVTSAVCEDAALYSNDDVDSYRVSGDTITIESRDGSMMTFHGIPCVLKTVKRQAGK